MDPSAKLTKAKNVKAVKTMLNYVLGLDKKSKVVDETRRIEWERWNTPTKDVPELIEWWCRHIEMSNQRVRQSGRKGRPRVAMGYHFVYNYNLPEQYFQLYRMGIWDFVENTKNQDSRLRDFPGIVAYHFSRNRFHVHMLINPVAIDGTDAFFRVGIGDVWWKNDYYLSVRDAIVKGSLKVAVELGYADPDTYAIRITDVEEPGSRRPGVGEYLSQTNEDVYKEIREARGVAVF